MRKSLPDTLRGRRAAETRQKLIDTARTLFAKNGFHGIDIRTIAGAVGLSTGAVFGHFSGKAELFAACFPDDHVRLKTAEAICLALGGDWTAARRPWLEAADRALVGLAAERRAAA